MQLSELQTLKSLLASAAAIVDMAIANAQTQSTPAAIPAIAATPSLAIPRMVPGYLSIYRKLVEVLRAHGPMAYNPLYKLMGPEFTWNQTYRRAFADNDSLVKRGILILDTSVTPAVLSVAPDFEGDPNPDLGTYIEPILKADPSLSADDVLVQEMGRFFKTYTEEVVWPRNGGKGYRSMRVLRGLAPRGGLEGLIEHLVMRPGDDQLVECCKAGRPDASIEWLVTKNWHLFAHKPELVKTAKSNLEKAMADHP